MPPIIIRNLILSLASMQLLTMSTLGVAIGQMGVGPVEFVTGQVGKIGMRLENYDCNDLQGDIDVDRHQCLAFYTSHPTEIIDFAGERRRLESAGEGFQVVLINELAPEARVEPLVVAVEGEVLRTQLAVPAAEFDMQRIFLQESRGETVTGPLAVGDTPFQVRLKIDNNNESYFPAFVGLKMRPVGASDIDKTFIVADVKQRGHFIEWVNVEPGNYEFIVEIAGDWKLEVWHR